MDYLVFCCMSSRKMFEGLLFVVVVGMIIGVGEGFGVVGY